MSSERIVDPVVLRVPLVQPANSISGARGMIVISGAGGLSGAWLWVHDGTIFQPANGRSF